jgi:DNA-binding NarL/FixJ family response regulator
MDRHRVCVSDPDPGALSALRTALDGDELEVCGAAVEADQMVETVLRELPELCVVDVDLPGGSIDAVAAIKAALPATAVVMMGWSCIESELFESLHAGACGYLLKDIAPARLAHVLLGVLNGEAALPRALMAWVLEEFRHHASSHLPYPTARTSVDLTSRERQVLSMLRAGATTAEMARALYVSPVTIRSHVSAILRKLDVHDRDAALRLLNGTGRVFAARTSGTDGRSHVMSGTSQSPRT